MSAQGSEEKAVPRGNAGTAPVGEGGMKTLAGGESGMKTPVGEGGMKTSVGESGMKTPVSPAALAYLGDAVIEVWVRERLVRSGISGTRELNSAALEYVTAPRQAAAMKSILPILNEEESAIFRRGRNIGHTSLPRRASAAEYRSATGFEALMGYLHLNGRAERIEALLTAAYTTGKEEKNEQSEN